MGHVLYPYHQQNVVEAKRMKQVSEVNGKVREQEAVGKFHGRGGPGAGSWRVSRNLSMGEGWGRREEELGEEQTTLQFSLMHFGEANNKQSYYYFKTSFSYEDNTSQHFPSMRLFTNFGYFHIWGTVPTPSGHKEMQVHSALQMHRKW